MEMYLLSLHRFTYLLASESLQRERRSEPAEIGPALVSIGSHHYQQEIALRVARGSPQRG
jgi:hypothetical protein